MQNHVKSTLSDFFKESDTQLGVFYPKHYVIAVFRNLAAAQQAAATLQLAGFAGDEVTAVAGTEIIQLAEENTGLGPLIMQELSRFFATEQMSTDKDLEWAHAGAGFVAVHCPTEESKQEAWAALSREGPMAARYYSNAGVEHLAGDFTTN